MDKVLLFINGLPPKDIPDSEKLKEYTLITCTDGAYTEYVKDLPLKIDYISGDLDSLDLAAVAIEIPIISTPDQNKTDFHKALEILYMKKFFYIDVYGATGKESDHFIGNLSTGLFFKEKLQITFYDDYSRFFFSDKKTFLSGVKGRTISLIPFFEATNIYTTGLKYPLKSENLKFPERIGTRNIANENEVSIEYLTGELLIFINKN